MEIANAQYSLNWIDRENNLTNLFVELLKKNELIDVILAADGYLFNAHQLILSAISPYFRKMFIQMSSNQCAFVFLKDISKETLEKIITFIYCGNVMLDEGDLKDFFATAHALEIVGLTGDICLDYIDQSVPLDTESAIYAINGIQYQSMATVRNYGVDNGIQAHNRGQTVEYIYVDQIEHAGNDMGIDQTQYLMANETNISDSLQTQFQPSKAKKRLRRYKDPIDYTFRADIRPNARQTKHLYYDGHEFTVNRIGVRKVLWQCSKKRTKRCHASISTVNVNGVIMMKVMKAVHNHL